MDETNSLDELNAEMASNIESNLMNESGIENVFKVGSEMTTNNKQHSDEDVKALESLERYHHHHHNFERFRRDSQFVSKMKSGQDYSNKQDGERDQLVWLEGFSGQHKQQQEQNYNKTNEEDKEEGEEVRKSSRIFSDEDINERKIYDNGREYDRNDMATPTNELIRELKERDRNAMSSRCWSRQRQERKLRRQEAEIMNEDDAISLYSASASASTTTSKSGLGKEEKSEQKELDDFKLELELESKEAKSIQIIEKEYEIEQQQQQQQEVEEQEQGKGGATWIQLGEGISNLICKYNMLQLSPARSGSSKSDHASRSNDNNYNNNSAKQEESEKRRPSCYMLPMVLDEVASKGWSESTSEDDEEDGGINKVNMNEECTGIGTSSGGGCGGTRRNSHIRNGLDNENVVEIQGYDGQYRKSHVYDDNGDDEYDENDEPYADVEHELDIEETDDEDEQLVEDTDTEELSIADRKKRKESLALVARSLECSATQFHLVGKGRNSLVSISKAQNVNGMMRSYHQEQKQHQHKHQHHHHHHHHLHNNINRSSGKSELHSAKLTSNARAIECGRLRASASSPCSLNTPIDEPEDYESNTSMNGMPMSMKKESVRDRNRLFMISNLDREQKSNDISSSANTSTNRGSHRQRHSIINLISGGGNQGSGQFINRIFSTNGQRRLHQHRPSLKGEWNSLIGLRSRAASTSAKHLSLGPLSNQFESSAIGNVASKRVQVNVNDSSRDSLLSNNNNHQYDPLIPESGFKIVVMGTSGSGKTSIIQRFLYDSFSWTHSPTVEDTYFIEFPYRKNMINISISDTSGTYQFPAMRRLAINSADAFILVYSVDNPKSFDELEELRQTILMEREQAYLEQASASIVNGKQNDQTIGPIKAMGIASPYNECFSANSSTSSILVSLNNSQTHSINSNTNSLSSYCNNQSHNYQSLGVNNKQPDDSQQQTQKIQRPDVSPSRHWSLASLFSSQQQQNTFSHSSLGSSLSSSNHSVCSSADNSRRSSISAAEAALRTRRTRYPPMVVVANKHDLPIEKHLVNSDAKQAQVVIDWNNGFVRASAALNWNVDDIFQQVLKQAKQPPTLSEAIVSKRRKSLPPKLPNNTIAMNHVMNH